MKQNCLHTILQPAIALLTLALATTACNKALEVTPKYILNAEKAFENDSAAALQIAGIYGEFTSNSDITSGMHLDISLLADDMEPLSYTAVAGSSGYALYNYILRPIDAPTNNYWINFYKYIYYTNSIIAGTDASTGMSAAYKKQCKGEALAWRAFFYYYLTSFYGALPYITDGDYTVTSHYTRTGTDSILAYCVADLKAADTLISTNYPTPGKFRFNRTAVNALLARVCLGKGDYQGAITAANTVLNDSRYTLATLTDEFSANSSEVIMQVWNQYGYTNVAQTANNSYATYGATHENDGNLYDAFEAGDARRDRFIHLVDDGTGTNLYLNNKYTNNGMDMNTDQTEYLVLFKLDEVLLNRAEAYARLQQTEDAHNDVNLLRNRAGLDNLPATLSGQNLTDAIIEERRKELCFEWGDRWLSLKRNNTANTVLSAFKPTAWNKKALLFPIPLSDIQNSSLLQNTGY